MIEVHDKLVKSRSRYRFQDSFGYSEAISLSTHKTPEVLSLLCKQPAEATGLVELIYQPRRIVGPDDTRAPALKTPPTDTMYA